MLGWLNESLRFFWDLEKSKLKEIIPIKFGERNGNYYAFFEDGKVAARGRYVSDSRVGVWTEFFNTGKKREKLIMGINHSLQIHRIYRGNGIIVVN